MTLLGLAAAALLMVGCEQVENLQDQFCQQLEKVAEPLDSLEGVDAASKLEDLKSAADRLGKVLDTLDATGIDLGLGSLDNVRKAFEDLEQKLADAEAGGDTAGTTANIEEAVTKLREEYNKLHRQVCGSGD
jgi:hypothetical protein